MCRVKPGPRCPSCQEKALTSAHARLAQVVDRMKAAPPGVRRSRLEAQARDIARVVACRRSDLYSTRSYQQRAEHELAELIASNPKDPQIPELAARLAEGRVMEHYRRQQAQLMPPPPTLPAASKAHRDLGAARFEMAHAQLRMDQASGNNAEWKLWQTRHLEAAQRGALAAAQLEAIESSQSARGWADLSADEKRTLRDKCAARGTFDTPLVPRPYQDVLDETQDVLDGVQPVREVIDDSGVPPFGDPTPRTAPPAASLSSPADTGADDDAASPRGGRRSTLDPPDRQRLLQKQTRRRSARRRSAMAEWRKAKRAQRSLERIERQAEQHIDSAVDDDLTAGTRSLFDVAFLGAILDSASNNQRR